MRNVIVTLVVLLAVTAAAALFFTGCCCGHAKMSQKWCGGGVCATTACEKQVEVAPANVNTEASINTAGLAALLRANTPVVLLDARVGKYNDGRRILGAKSLNTASTVEEITKILPDKNALVVTYCGGLACTASPELAYRLRAMGYANVVEYPEGIPGWIESGNKVQEPSR